MNLTDLTELYEKNFFEIKKTLGSEWTSNTQTLNGEKRSVFMYHYNQSKDTFDEGVRKIENGYMIELNYLLRYPDYYNVLLAKALRDLKFIGEAEDMQVFQLGNYQVGFVIKNINSRKIHMVTIAKI